MRSAIGRLNIGYYKKLLANEAEPEKRQILLRLLSDEKAKLVSFSCNKTVTPSNDIVHDLSRVVIHGCIQASVRNSILKLRRGPILERKKHAVFVQGDPADYIILVVHGTIRTCRYARSGKRSVVGFYFEGDTLGWSDEKVRSLTAEAATDCTLLYLKRSSLTALASQNPLVKDFILAATKNELRRAQEYSLFIGKDANSRTAAFLFDLWDRIGKSDSLIIPMTYQDIADHLGLSLECVSRTINSLIRAEIFGRISCHELALRNRSSLKRLAG